MNRARFTIALVSLLAIVFLLCLGASVFFVLNFTGEGSSDPATIDAVRNQMAELVLPSGYLPAAYGRLGTLRFVAYVNPKTDGRIGLIEDSTKTEDAKNENDKRLSAPPMHLQLTTDVLQDVKSQSKPIRIKGKECPFEFSQGNVPASRQTRRRVSGTFEGKGGLTTIEVDMKASDYHEGQIVKMLEGIR
jgi:hypothetical protein